MIIIKFWITIKKLYNFKKMSKTILKYCLCHRNSIAISVNLIKLELHCWELMSSSTKIKQYNNLLSISTICLSMVLAPVFVISGSNHSFAFAQTTTSNNGTSRSSEGPTTLGINGTTSRQG